MSSEIEPHITKKYEIKKRLGKGVSEVCSWSDESTDVNLQWSCRGMASAWAYRQWRQVELPQVSGCKNNLLGFAQSELLLGSVYGL